MAISQEGLAAERLLSIHGKRLGMDKSDFLVGSKPIREVVTNATTDSSGTNILNHGYHTVSSTTSGGWVVDDPVPGCKVFIGAISASTNAITFNNATVYSTNGVASSSAKFNAIGESITLVGISTASWMCTSNVNAVVFSS